MASLQVATPSSARTTPVPWASPPSPVPDSALEDSELPIPPPSSVAQRSRATRPGGTPGSSESVAPHPRKRNRQKVRLLSLYYNKAAYKKCMARARGYTANKHRL